MPNALTNIGLSPATATNQISSAIPLSGRMLYRQASADDRPYTLVAIQFADGAAEQKTSLANQFIDAAGQEGITKLSVTPEGQYALQIVYDHAGSDGQKLMREVHEGQGNTAVDYTHKNENVCTAEALQEEGATPEEQQLNNLMKQYGDHISGEMPLPPSESIRLRNEIDRVSQIVNSGQQNLWGDYSPQEKQYLAEQALQTRQAANNLGIWVGGPVFSALPALGRVLDAPEPVVEGLGQINGEMAGGKAFGRQGRGIRPVDVPTYSGPVKTYVLDPNSVKIELPMRGVQDRNVAPDRRLLNELSSQGIKYTPENIVGICKDPYGRIFFLETGNSRAGLQHIVEGHGADFARRGITESQISEAVMAAVKRGNVVGHQGRRPIYEVEFNGQTHRIAVTTGGNGFIVGANPAR